MKEKKKGRQIHVFGAKEHNLKNLQIHIPRDQFVVITGVSGSGKSSLAFDTIFAEGQRKYMESLSSYARQFLRQMNKPDIERMEGLPPTIAIEQRSSAHNPRSTVATTTEIYDYLRLLFARCGQARCWHRTKKGQEVCGQKIQKQSASQITESVMSLPEGSVLTLLAPVVKGKKGFHKDCVENLQKEGFIKARVNGEIVFLDELDLQSDNPLSLGRYETHNIEALLLRTKLLPKNQQQIADSVEGGLRLSQGTLIACVQKEKGKEVVETIYSEFLACPLHPSCSLDELEPRLFSFNSPYGACSVCSGLGMTQEFDLDKVLDKSLSIAQGAFLGLDKIGYFYKRHYGRIITKICRSNGIDRHQPFHLLDPEDQDLLLCGCDSKKGKKAKSQFRGFLSLLSHRMVETENEKVREGLNHLLVQAPCNECKGGRLRKEALAVWISSKACGEANIADVTSMSVFQAEKFFEDLELTPEQEFVAAPILKEVRSRLHFLRSVGLGYLNLSRKTSSLSGGEAQRIRLASQVGTGLVGVCYVLDEPTIGLHQRDNTRLIQTLKNLRDIGNSVIVVEHDEEMMESADHIIDIGPGPGVHGGQVVAQGTLQEIKKNKKSLTGQFLSGKQKILMRPERRSLSLSHSLCVKKAVKNNLKAIDVHFPLGGFLCVTGVSGSGKSTLVNEILLKSMQEYLQKAKKRSKPSLEGLEHIARVVAVDQSPIGRTPRSNPATYTGLFDAIRSLFAQTPQAITRGYQAGRFSFNVKGGRCEDCQGQGTKKIEMHFLADVYVTCESCGGLRYNAETLQVKYKGKNIAEVLSMTVEEALEFFEVHPKMQRVLHCLREVGLDYIQLGQSSTTLSGGEAQRVKLSAELSRYKSSVPKNQHTVYVLDEPTTGLHFSDIKKVIDVFHQLVDRGNTVIVIEHNLDVIKCSDWIIDLGPEGGDEGGELIACGPPEKVVQSQKSHTGLYLKGLLNV